MMQVKTVANQRKRGDCHRDGAHGKGGASRMRVIFLYFLKLTSFTK